jgi:hypothetical protein
MNKSKRKIDDREWWKRFKDASEAFGSLCFSHLAYDGPGDGFKDDKERLAAWRFNLTRFFHFMNIEQRQAFQKKIERLTRVIDGTEAAHQQAEVERTRKLAHDSIKQLVADGKMSRYWKGEDLLAGPASPPLESLLAPGEVMPEPGPACVAFFEKKGYDVSDLSKGKIK